MLSVVTIGIPGGREKKMRVLIVQNYQNTGLGQVGKALSEAGAEIDLRERP